MDDKEKEKLLQKRRLDILMPKELSFKDRMSSIRSLQKIKNSPLNRDQSKRLVKYLISKQKSVIKKLKGKPTKINKIVGLRMLEKFLSYLDRS